MKRILVLAALALASAQPAYADGWTAWRQFASHNGVILEWRTYSHPDHDTLADWRVTNHTRHTLYNLALGTRYYSCPNRSRVFKVRSSIGGLELRPGDYVELSDGGAANYIGADGFPRSECPSILDAKFDGPGDSRALWFAVGDPYEDALPWTAHNFAADPSAPSSPTASTVSCFYHDRFHCVDFFDPPDPSLVRQDCNDLGGQLLNDSSCPKNQSYSCRFSDDRFGHRVGMVYDLHSFLDWSFDSAADLDHLPQSWISGPPQERFVAICEEAYDGTFLGYTD